MLGERFDETIEALIEHSGGYPREVVRSLRWLLRLQKLPASREDVERMFAENRDSFRSLVTEKDLEWLARVAEARALVCRDEGEQQVADRALQNNLVLRYLNRETWFDLHPAVQELVDDR